MFAIVGRWLATISLWAIFVSSGLAQNEIPSLRVATRVVSPLVIEQNGQLTGFSIELWNSIAERIKVKTNYQIAPDINALLAAVGSNQADLGISAISITSERDLDFDFSQPILNAGLQIMVRSEGAGVDTNPLRDLLHLLFSRTILVWLGIVLLLILIPAHLMWLLERRSKNRMLTNTNYFPGIFSAMFWAASTLATQADQMPRQWLARVLAVLWMFTAVVFVAYFTARLTASFTVQQIQGGINGPDELPGRRVGTTRGSTAAVYLRERNALVQEFASIDGAFAALLGRQLDAVVFDAPVLLYYSAHRGKGRVAIVGSTFHKEDYGIVFQPNSPLRKQVNGAFLALREDGTYQQIYDKWFGSR